MSLRMSLQDAAQARYWGCCRPARVHAPMFSWVGVASLHERWPHRRTHQAPMLFSRSTRR